MASIKSINWLRTISLIDKNFIFYQFVPDNVNSEIQLTFPLNINLSFSGPDTPIIRPPEPLVAILKGVLRHILGSHVTKNTRGYEFRRILMTAHALRRQCISHQAYYLIGFWRITGGKSAQARWNNKEVYYRKDSEYYTEDHYRKALEYVTDIRTEE